MTEVERIEEEIYHDWAPRALAISRMIATRGVMYGALEFYAAGGPRAFRMQDYDGPDAVRRLYDLGLLEADGGMICLTGLGWTVYGLLRIMGDLADKRAREAES